MTYLMYDTTGDKAHLIPENAPIVAGYDDGLYAWGQAQWDLFPNAHKLHISVLANPASDTFDSEQGNASQAEVADAVATRASEGKRSVIYCNTSDYPSQLAACHDRGVDRKAWDWWGANYSIGTNIPNDAVGLQYSGTISGSYDISLMRESWADVYFAPNQKGKVPNMKRLNQPIVDIVKDPTSNGYWLIGADGGIFPFGKVFMPKGNHLPAAGLSGEGLIISATCTPTGLGLYLVSASGNVYTFGDASYKGSVSMFGIGPSTRPIV
ncbi:MAG: hypothetical protein ACRDOH_32815 [Streptosporangiaceae bacterium]